MTDALNDGCSKKKNLILLHKKSAVVVLTLAAGNRIEITDGLCYDKTSETREREAENDLL